MSYLTFVLPVYLTSENAIQKAHAAVASIMNEKCECDVVVVDDCSPLAFAIEPMTTGRIRIVRHERNQGAGSARNTGMKHSTTSLVSFLDYDDELIPGSLKHRIRYALGEGGFPDLRNTPSCIQGCGWEEIRRGGAEVRTRFALSSRSADDFFRGCWFCPGSTVIANRRFLLDRIGGFDPAYRRLEDMELFIRAGLAGASYRAIPVKGARILHHRSKSSQDIENACQLLIRSYLSRDDERVDILTSHQKRRLRTYLHLERTNVALLKKRYANAAYHALRYALSRPDRSTRWSSQHNS
ncbi:MAG: glycosyltransferase [Hyphomonas sp.]|nr:glycosyltransferase [Hyphomonas sp.]